MLPSCIYTVRAALPGSWTRADGDVRCGGTACVVPSAREGLADEKGACPIKGVMWRRRDYVGRVRRWPSASYAIVRGRGSSLWFSAHPWGDSRRRLLAPPASSLTSSLTGAGASPETLHTQYGVSLVLKISHLLVDFRLRRLEPLPCAWSQSCPLTTGQF